MAKPTLARIREDNCGLQGHCLDCGAARELDMAALIAKLGAELPAMDLNGRLKCTTCAGRRTEITVYSLGAPTLTSHP